MHPFEDTITRELSARPGGLKVGIDIVRVSEVADALSHFGTRYLERLFTDEEAGYAQSGTCVAERLSARFAAKEAALKALDLCHAGVDLKDIEVVRHDDGHCTLRFHGRAAQLVAARGELSIALSMSHDGEYAAAAVTAHPVSFPSASNAI
jgi:holo-[acyl-carrier protein] synthase